MQVVAVNTLKAKLSQYLNALQETDEPIYITKRGKIVAKLENYNKEKAWEAAKKRLKGSVLYYEGETDPVGEEDWEALK